MKKILASLLVLAFCSHHSFAQSTGVRPQSVGFSIIGNDYATAERIRTTSLATVLREKSASSFKQMGHGAALHYIKGFTRNIDFNASIAGSFVKFALPGKTTAENDFLLEADASANFKMLPDGVTLNPYLTAGIGASKYTNVLGAFVPLGVGMELNMFNEARLFTQFQYRVPVTTEANKHHFMVSFGIMGFISDRKEEPKVIEPVKPLDTDGDGVYDADDKCPTVFGLAKYQGCPVPDTDKDGINDEADKCPDVPGVAKYQGCPVPDTDKDGVNDEEDKCPTVAGVARYQGCPVPDTDNDGINDEEDRCPTVAGVASNGGCPEVKEEVIKQVNVAAKNIFFATGSAKLLVKSNAALNDVAKLLAEDTNLKVEISGHTDNVGKADFNQTLSEKRAAAVRDYLVKKGVDENRLTANGYGMDKPVASNKTASGRAKNRRVEMQLTY